MVNDFTPEELDDLVSPTELLGLQADGDDDTALKTTAGLAMLRKRHGNFPQPRGTGRTPLFRLGDVVDWFNANRPDVRLRPTPTWRVARSVEALRTAHPLEAARPFAIGALAVCGTLATQPDTTHTADLTQAVGSLDAPDDQRTAIAALIGAVSGDDPAAIRLIRALTASTAAAPDAGGINNLESEVLQRLTGMATPTSTTTSPDALVDTILAVADPDRTPTIFDPTAGEASLLLAAGKATGWTAELSGQEQDPTARNIAHARSYLQGTHVNLGAQPADSLNHDQFPGEGAALVLCDPPFAGRGFAKWLNHALTHTRPDGRAVVALPIRTLEPGRPEWPNIPFGTVEAIVACPPKLRQDTGEAIAIWSITHHPNNNVLIVDATKGDPHHTTPAIRNALRQWRQGTEPDTNPALPHAIVPATQIRAHHGDLRPATWCPDTTDTTQDQKRRALELATELTALINGDLRTITTDEQRRGLDRLTQRLTQHLQRDTTPTEPKNTSRSSRR